MPQHWREGAGRPKIRYSRDLYKRATEAIEYLMEQNCFFEGSKQDFAMLMAERYGTSWLKADGKPDRRLVEDVCNLTRDQEGDAVAQATLAGYMIGYADNHGGLVLLDPSGEQPYHHQLLWLNGDNLRQRCHKTENRRRASVWKAARDAAFREGDLDVGLLIGQIEREIETTGFLSDSLSAEYERLLRERGLVA